MPGVSGSDGSVFEKRPQRGRGLHSREELLCGRSGVRRCGARVRRRGRAGGSRGFLYRQRSRRWVRVRVGIDGLNVLYRARARTMSKANRPKVISCVRAWPTRPPMRMCGGALESVGADYVLVFDDERVASHRAYLFTYDPALWQGILSIDADTRVSSWLCPKGTCAFTALPHGVGGLGSAGRILARFLPRSRPGPREASSYLIDATVPPRGQGSRGGV